MFLKECRFYKVLKAIPQSKHDRDNDVRFHYSNRALYSQKWFTETQVKQIFLKSSNPRQIPKNEIRRLDF